MTTQTTRLFQLISTILSGVFSLFVGILIAVIVILTSNPTNHYQYGIPSSIALAFFSLLFIAIGLICLVAGLKTYKNSLPTNSGIVNEREQDKSNNLIAPIHYIASESSIREEQLL